VPAQPYGSRFVQFIEGITKTREEAQRDEELQAAEENLIQTDAANGATDIVAERPPRSQEMRRSESTNSVIRKAESAAVKSERRGGSEDNVPDKVLSTVDSPSGDRGAERGDTVLPIVDEAGESSSTGGRSRRSDSVEARPVTPPKDNVKSRNISERARGDRSRGSSFNSNKALPELPREASSSSLNKAGKLRLRESMDSGHSSGSDTPWKLALRGVSNGRNETEV
jgi:1-phosphatidylinositol-4-phosphate 5-kinase